MSPPSPPCPPPALQVWALTDLPLVQAGDDLAELICSAMTRLGLEALDGDVLVVAQKVVSKAEGRQARLAEVAPSSDAEKLSTTTGKPAELCQLILSETAEVMRAGRDLVIVRHRLGAVTANAGIDASNVADPAGPETVLLWPLSPDASAARLRETLQARFKARLAVIISDSLGRAWRMGTIGTAIGVAGMDPVLDRRGEVDLFGRELRATVIGRADEIASAASLVIGEGAEGIAAALVRGASFTPTDESGGIDALLRPLEQDLFR